MERVYAICPASLIDAKPSSWTTMTEPFSKSRQQAEVAFAKTQSTLVARSRTAAETSLDAQARADKTLRLKTARLKKESDDLAKSSGEQGSLQGKGS